MLGAEMLLKSMGVDPDEIKSQFEKTAAIAQEKMTQFQDQLNRIEANQFILHDMMVRAGLIESFADYNKAKAEEAAQRTITLEGINNGTRTN